jgi:hypothetical protein
MNEKLMYAMIYTLIHMICANSSAVFMVDRIGRMPNKLICVAHIVCLAIAIYTLIDASFYDNMQFIIKYVIKLIIQMIMYSQMVFNNVYVIQKTKENITLNEVIYCNYLLISSTINHLVMFMLF